MHGLRDFEFYGGFVITCLFVAGVVLSIDTYQAIKKQKLLPNENAVEQM